MSDQPAPVLHPTIAGMALESAPDYQSIYSNFFRYRITPTELSITFATVMDKGGAMTAATIVDRVQIMMPHGQAKALMEYLKLLIERYEEEFGPVRAPGPAYPSRDEVESHFATLRAIGTHT